MQNSIDFDKSTFCAIIELSIVKQIVETMLAVEQFRIAYLNLNPENIVVDQHDKIFFKNFGIAEEF